MLFHLSDLKNQADNLWLLLGSVEAELSRQQKQVELADSTEAWLYVLREGVAEEDTQEASALADSSSGSSCPASRPPREPKTVRL